MAAYNNLYDTEKSFYAGDVVYGKYKKDKVGGKNHLKPRSEWKITYNHHEPIVEREIFDAVQQTRGRTKPYQPQKAHILMGRLYAESAVRLCVIVKQKILIFIVMNVIRQVMRIV